MGQRILALELGGDRVRAAMADRTFKSLELAGVYEQQRTADEVDLSGAIMRVVKAAGPPDLVISALPGEFVAKRLLALPFTDRRRLQQVVPFALEEHLPFAVDDAAVAFARVGREGPNTLVVAAFARKDDLHRHLELLARAGLDPKAITLSALALAGFLARARNGHGGSHLVIDIDQGCTSMVLIDAVGTPRAMRTVGQGLNPRNGGGPMPQHASSAILGAVRQTLLAHGAEDGAPRLVLTGPAALPEIRNQIASALDVPVHDLGEFDCSALIPGTGAEPMRFAGCIAMLLGESPRNPIELLNFRQGELAFRGRAGTATPLRLSIILACAAIGLVAANFMIGVSASGRQLHSIDRQIEAAVAPALGDPNAATAKTALKAKIADMNKRLRLMGGSLGHGSPLDVMLALSRAIPPNMPVQINSLVVDDTGVKLEGTADSFTTVDQVKRALERSHDFGQIQVDHAAAGSDASKVDFRLSTTIDEAAF
jgi:type II secretion system protein L